MSPFPERADRREVMPVAYRGKTGAECSEVIPWKGGDAGKPVEP